MSVADSDAVRTNYYTSELRDGLQIFLQSAASCSCIINFALTYRNNAPTLILSPTFTLPELVLPVQDPGRARGLRPRQEHRAGRGVTLPVPGHRAPAAVHTEREQLRHRRLPER